MIPAHPIVFDKVVVVETTTLCNLSCPFCAYDHRLKIKRKNIDQAHVNRLIDSLGLWAMQHQKHVLISWLGGEPFWQKEVMQWTESARATYPLYFSGTTNGTPLQESFVRKQIAEHFYELTLSIDGLASFHDEMRGRKGLFDFLKHTLALLRNEAPRLRIRVNVVLMRSNFEMFPLLCQELHQWGIQEVTINQLGGRDRPEFYPENRLLQEQVKKLPAMVQELRKAYPLLPLVFNDAYYRRFYASATDQKIPVEECYPGRSYFFVDVEGRMAPCPYTCQEYGHKIERLQTSLDMDQLPLQFSQKRALEKASYCLDCPCTNVHGKFVES
ncbi:MAG: radical SAM protein [Cytophagaceae bacterium]|jgi:radical SAM protein with 4Fe4S-binding SPASM domain|nr:radical SAM protein [Cytophagaceae bacterium]